MPASRKSQPSRIIQCEPADKNKALDVIAKARADGRDSLTEIEAKQVFAAYGLPVTTIALAKTEDEAVEIAVANRIPGGDEDRFSGYSAQI